MKIVQFLSAAAFIAVMSTASVLADNTAPGEIQTPGQPFTHPSSDESYAKNLHEDASTAGAGNTRIATGNTVPYVSGGVGDMGMDEMQAQQSAYNVKTLFVSQPNGEYLSNINVTIANSKGENVLNTRTDGPVLLAQLPPGHYTVTAISDESNQTLTKHITTGKNQSQYVFRFRQEEG